MTVRTTTRRNTGRVLVAAMTLGLATPLLGCAMSVGGADIGWSSVEENRQLGIEHVPGKPLLVKTRNGGITVTKTSGGPVDVRATVRGKSQEQLRQIKVVAVRDDDGTLVVKAEFPEGKARDGAGVSLEVLIPDAEGLNLATSNGAITAAGFSGKAVMDTSNGAITLSDHAGEAVLDTSNGRITVERLRGGVTADTSNGGITLKDVGTPVTADTSNGTIDVVLDDAATGPVRLDSSNARIELAVGAAFGGELIADTSNGKVTVDLGTEAAQVSTNKRGNEAKVVFAASGQRSVVDTSNGSIRISRREK